MSGDPDLVIAFWKPYGVLSAFTDREGRATLAEYIEVPDVYPAGRLDRDSEGLLLLPRSAGGRGRLTESGHARRYLVQVEGIPGDQELDRLRRGVDLKDGRTQPALVVPIDPPDLPPRDPPIRVRKSVPDSWVELTLTEGRNRQVRRMTAAVGHPTLRLVRDAIGPVTLAGLREGAWRVLDAGERAALESALVSSARRAGASRRGPGRRRRAPRSPG